MSLVVAFSLPDIARAQETVVVDTSHPIRTVRPQFALGSTVDKEPAGSIPALYSHQNIRQMLEAGYGWLSYRLFTELSVQDWHWNPAGHFSAAGGGYWTGDDSTARGAITDSYGYRLPHSGFTSDQGNNEGYSRLTDGDLQSYWKSNPYLTRRFTGDPDSTHPQWVVIDSGSIQILDAIRIAFAQPYARSYRIEYWTGSDPINDPVHGSWQTFNNGIVANATLAQASTLRSISAKQKVRFVRILLLQSSNTCDTHGSGDPRDCVGYAIDEVWLGRFDASHRFVDVLIHRPCGGEKPGKQRCGERQSATYVSSVDPWHTAENRVRNQEQPGLDLIARSGLTRNIPATYPVAMIYSTPENAVAEVRYLRARGYPIARIELGEEPDGQYMLPEDYAAFYVQWSTAIHRFDPSLKLGGPVFSGVNSDLQTWPDASGNVSWLNRFVRYLQSHHRMNDLAFMSFEHYPFDGCERGDRLTHDLLIEPSLMKGMVQAWRNDGIPANVPLLVTEANFSAVNFTEVPMTIEGALWQADYMASALSNGVDAVVYYQYEPVPLSQNADCPDAWGNLTMFVGDTQGRIRAHGAQFWAAKMLTQEWFAPGNATHVLYHASTNVKRGNLPLVTAYALERPDKMMSLMLINKDTRAHGLRVQLGNGTQTGRAIHSDVVQVTLSPAQYVWRRHGAASVPSPDGPPFVTIVKASTNTTFELPARSITVLRVSLKRKA